MRRIVAAVLDGADGRSAFSVPGGSSSGADRGSVPGGDGRSAPDGASTHAPRAGPAGEATRIAIGADHGGYVLKERIGRWLRDAGYAVEDCGTTSSDAVDYPDFAHAVARLVADGSCRWGIVVDGAGIGSCMVANKVPGVRAACCHDVSSARNSREHNHANVLTLGARLLGEGLALEIVETWLTTPWGPGRHAARVEKIVAVERRYLATAEQGAWPVAGTMGGPQS